MAKFSAPKKNVGLDEAMDPEAFADAADASADLPTNDMPAADVDQLIADIDRVAEVKAEVAASPAVMSMDQVIALLKATQGNGFSPDDLKSILSEVMQSAAKSNASAMQTALNRENPNYKTASPFHDADGKEATPKYDVYFGPSHTNGKGGMLPRDMFTPYERDLVNRFAIGQTKTSRDGNWMAECVKNGSTQELIVKVPMGSMDQRGELPSFAMILTELLDGALATSPEALLDRVAELERKLAAAAA